MTKSSMVPEDDILDEGSKAQLTCYKEASTSGNSGKEAANESRFDDVAGWMRNVIWFNLLVVTITPLVSLYGILTTPIHRFTAIFCVVYYVFNMIGTYLILFRVTS